MKFPFDIFIFLLWWSELPFKHLIKHTNLVHISFIYNFEWMEWNEIIMCVNMNETNCLIYIFFSFFFKTKLAPKLWHDHRNAARWSSLCSGRTNMFFYIYFSNDKKNKDNWVHYHFRWSFPFEKNTHPGRCDFESLQMIPFHDFNWFILISNNNIHFHSIFLPSFFLAMKI